MVKIPPRTRDAYLTFRPLATRWIDNDIYGHMNNVVHYQLFDTAVNGWLLDVGAIELSGNDVFFVGETTCRYFAQLHFPQKIEAGLRITHLGRSSVRYDVGLFVQGEGLPAAEGEFLHIHVDRKANRSLPLPDYKRQSLQTILVTT